MTKSSIAVICKYQKEYEKLLQLTARSKRDSFICIKKESDLKTAKIISYIKLSDDPISNKIELEVVRVILSQVNTALHHFIQDKN